MRQPAIKKTSPVKSGGVGSALNSSCAGSCSLKESYANEANKMLARSFVEAERRWL
jgi:hypothetical protein